MVKATFTMRFHDVLAGPLFSRVVSGSHTLRAAFGAMTAAAVIGVLAGPASAGELTQDKFAAIMDATFGHGAWRMTGGYRSPEREDQLRAQGAMTVRPGGTSRHSMGSRDAPGAYDLVVNGMSPYEAANRLRATGAPFARYQPKDTHGTQGPHLHLEPYGFGAAPTFQMASNKTDPKADTGRARAVTLVMPATTAKGVAAIRQQLVRLRAAADQDDPNAQLELGRAYAMGYVVPRDFETAQFWLQAAVENASDAETHAEAAASLAEVSSLLSAKRAQEPTRFAQLDATGAR